MNSTDHRQRLQWVAHKRARLQTSQQRQLLSLQGSQQWCDDWLAALLSQEPQALVCSNRALGTNSIPFAAAETMLGSETNLLVVDLFDGLNPDVICIVSGMVKAGGMLVLLSPPTQHWGNIEDRYGVWQDAGAIRSQQFIDYFFDQLGAAPDAGLILRENQAYPELWELPISTCSPIVSGKTLEQTEVLSQVEGWLGTQGQKFLLLCAHRGRGKSACLGLIVREHLLPGGYNVIVTAYAKRSASVLLEYAGEVQFVAPDQLIRTRQAATVLVIDEAAMLPYPMLLRLCQLYPKVLMATTTGGYEGTGQGFLLRFIARLPQQQLLRLSLAAPVRWGLQDRLESWLDQTLLLDPVIPAEATVAVEDCRFRIVQAIDCNQDVALMRRIYGLLVSAHYRTRPSDLRMLMENPDLSLVLAETDDALAGVALVNAEGGFDAGLCEQVFLGNRRPRGHLLAQMITAQAGVKSFAGYRGLRIQRIAVPAGSRRQGIGRQLLQAAMHYGAREGVDYVGACYAFEAETAAFWQTCGFQLAHIGFAQGKSSGNHSVAVLSVLNPALAPTISQLQQRLQRNLPLWFCQFLNQMDAVGVAALLRYSTFDAELTELELGELRAFTQGHKGFEMCFATLQRFVMQAVSRLPAETGLPEWMVARVIQNRDWEDADPAQDYAGRRQMQQQLRQLIADLKIS